MLPRNQAKKKFNQTHFFNNSFRHLSNNFNTNQVRNELTINVTKNEPRLVILNQHKVHQNFHQQTNPQHYQHSHGQSRPQAIPNFKSSKPNQSYSYHKNYSNNFRYKFNTQTNKLKAPYNTTQYLMYDYSKRRGPLKDQQCPDEQQQFTNDWNMALNQSEQNNEAKFLFCRKSEEYNEQMEHDGANRQEQQHHNNINNSLGCLKKSLSDLDLASDNDLSNFFSTSI